MTNRTAKKASHRTSTKPLLTTFIVVGASIIVVAFIMEFNFHFWQGFTSETTDPGTFWRMEAVVGSTSMALMVIGVATILLAGLYFNKKRNTC